MEGGKEGGREGGREGGGRREGGREGGGGGEKRDRLREEGKGIDMFRQHSPAQNMYVYEPTCMPYVLPNLIPRPCAFVTYSANFAQMA